MSNSHTFCVSERFSLYLGMNLSVLSVCVCSARLKYNVVSLLSGGGTHVPGPKNESKPLLAVIIVCIVQKSMQCFALLQIIHRVGRIKTHFSSVLYDTVLHRNCYYHYVVHRLG